MLKHEANMGEGLMSAPCGGRKGPRGGWIRWTRGCGLETVRGGTSSAGAGVGGREAVGGRKGALAPFCGESKRAEVSTWVR